jgi:Rps23 Pro-64 3,4-dihydroxylase Tpa1-like proline 4-hydroxylase
MNYKILENFIDKKSCLELIDDAKKYSHNDHLKVQNERLILPSSSINFLNLIKKSNAWNNLHKYLNSQNFLKKLQDELKIQDQKLLVTNFFFKKEPNYLLKKYKFLNSKKISTIGTINLFFYIIFKFYRFLERKIRFSFTSKKFVELLYDYSISPNGYYREIHRDSDARTIVFLIYLNDLQNDGSGGELNLYKFNKDGTKIPSQPNENDCILLKSIPPKTGTLVTFLNSHDSLHAVSKMKNHNNLRHFLYGSFTLLGKKNNFLKNSVGSLKTNFNIFE